MKLYYSLLEGWQVPGQQAKAALRVDLPNSPADMAAWLNARGVTMTARPQPSPELEEQYQAAQDTRIVPTPTAPRAPSYTEQSIQLDEDFDRLPLSRQLDFAARAMENARERL